MRLAGPEDLRMIRASRAILRPACLGFGPLAKKQAHRATGFAQGQVHGPSAPAPLSALADMAALSNPILREKQPAWRGAF